MNVKILSTGKELEVDNCFGARLIEQGQAVPAKTTEAVEQQPAQAAEDRGKAKKKG